MWYGLKKNEATNTKISCFNENILRINLEYIFNNNLNQYLIKHPYNIPLDNYDYELQGSLEIIGKATEPLKFDILKDESKQIAKESVKTPEGLIDFTGTELCAKGQNCILAEDAFKLLQEAQKKAKSFQLTSKSADTGKEILELEKKFKDVDGRKKVFEEEYKRLGKTLKT